MPILSDESIQGSSSSLASLNFFSNPSSPDLHPSRPKSAPVSLKRPSSESDEPSHFTKKGNTKKCGASLMEEAVKVMKEISQQPVPAVELPSITKDREEVFASFVASRLRLMDEEKKKMCENAIMSLLMEYY